LSADFDDEISREIFDLSAAEGLLAIYEGRGQHEHHSHEEEELPDQTSPGNFVKSTVTVRFTVI